jgi:hypothetical protein
VLEVDAMKRLPMLGFRLRERLRLQVVAHVVHEHIDAALAREDALDPARDRLGLADVERFGARTAALLRDRGRCLRAARRVDLGDLDASALAREPLGGRSPDPGAAARHERHAALEPAHLMDSARLRLAARGAPLAHFSSSTPK